MNADNQDHTDHKELDIDGIKQYWVVEADEALRVADHLFEKEDFSYSLFFGHLALEKILKSLFVVKHGKHAPLIHNLFRLATLSGLDVDEHIQNILITVTGFNIQARYPDEKRAFRTKCTREYTKDRLDEIKEVFEWLKSLLP